MTATQTHPTQTSTRPARTPLAAAPGIYLDMPFDEYLRLDALSASTIDRFHTSARTGVHYLMGEPTPPSREFRLGTALHMRLLEPDRFKNDCVEVEGLKDGAIASTRAKHDAEHPGKTVLSEGWTDLIERMAEGVLAHRLARRLLEHPSATSELTMVWDDPSLGVRCKCRFDLMVSNGLSAAAADLKTTKVEDLADFNRDAAKYGYHRKAAWYWRGAMAHGYDIRSMPFIAVQSSAPFECGVFEFDLDAVTRLGWAQCEEAAGRYRRWRETGEVVGEMDTTLRGMSVPPWLDEPGRQPVTDLRGGLDV